MSQFTRRCRPWPVEKNASVAPCLRVFPRASSRMTAMKAASAALALVLTGFLVSIAAQPAVRYDLLIRNARVLDGTGNPWFPADIGVQNGRIAVVGALPNAQAARTIDAAG